MNVNSRVKSTQGCRIKFGEASAYDDEGNQGRYLRGVEFGALDCCRALRSKRVSVRAGEARRGRKLRSVG